MCKLCRLIVLLIVITAPLAVFADSVESTRITDPNQHICSEDGGYPYRSKVDYVLKELDIKAGDIIVDIGAGDGWWADKMAKFVGSSGMIHASEVDQKKVDKMKERFKNMPQVRPYLCPLDGTDLAENTCDLVFLSKTYHHFSEGSHVDYLKHLHQIVKPTGRLCVIEKHIAFAEGRDREHAWSPALLVQQAEEAGWIIVRLEMLTGTHHFIALFVQKEPFSPKTTLNTKRQIDLSLINKSTKSEPTVSNQSSFSLYPIGTIERQNGHSYIVIDKKYQTGLKGLETHDYVHVVYWFDKNDTPERRAILQVHPRGDKNNPLTGVFATHSPFRPNLIAISKCDIISIKENVVEIKEIDAFDGSPVLDLKGDFFRFYKPDTNLNDKLIEEMKSYFGDKQGLIDHTMAVYGYANQLHKTEGGDPLVVKAGALYHDIGIPEARRVHGSSAGKYQEIEGPPIARKILNQLGVAPESVDHICRIIANHHTAHDEPTVKTIEFQIVWDADGLVNHAGRKLGSSDEEISRKIEQLFRTPNGKKMAREMFITK